MSYAGDIRLGDTIDLKFSTRSFSTGAPTTLAGTPVISAYPGNSTTQLTAGITLTVDFDTVTGLHNVRVVATSGNGYATATNYYLVITTGTVGGVSVVGEVVGSFSIEARSALMPTTAARTLDVTATGASGIDWANVENPTTTLGLSGTTVATVTTTTTATNVTTVNGLAANVVTATSIAASAMNGKGDWNIGKTGYSLTQTFPANFADLAITLTTGRVTVGTNADKTGYSISGTKTTLDALNDLSAAQVNAEVDSALDTAIPAVNTAGSANDVLLDVLNARLLGTVAAGTHEPQSGDSFARLGAPVGASTSADIAGVQSDTNDIQTRIPAALVGGRMDSNLGAISTSAAAADNLERSTLGIVTGTVGAASTTTSIVTSALSPAASVADQFKGRIVTFDANTTTAALRGQSTDITANTNVGVLTVTALTTAPVSGDTFVIT